ncbi:LOW QUALITY PROTEIN: hypothetical protein QTO34_007862 [Cnephaeus nilssonii]|uniref:Peptidase A2 domain-containing protein n=1 Tax=Cnephaeus nilssonii TaxID=3371016 RepID=A0AA40LG09_CNENI|nr:LOW QUALITY PROTEIN: hypothetical protein QTO34_007862 [Eptesicus nilssonii]
MVRINPGGQTVNCMVDTGAEHSVVTQKVAPLSGREVTIIGAIGTTPADPSAAPADLGSHQVVHEFPYLPDCPVPLMSRDLLAKMGAEITFAQDCSAQLRVGDLSSDPAFSSAQGGGMETLYSQSEDSPLEPELEEELPLKGTPGLARKHAPVLIDLKPGAQPAKLRQDPVPRNAIPGPSRATASVGTSLAKPGTSDYRPVQDLRAVNEAVVTLHWVLPTPYTLLGLIPSEAEWFTGLDKKDAFFCLQLAPSSQPLFAFKWENPTTGAKEQFTWTRLPQGFENSPTLPHGGKEHELRVSKRNAPICQREVKYLGFRITRGKRRLGTGGKQAVCAIPVPSTQRQIREFLGAAGFCQIWIPGFSELAKLFCEALKGEERHPLTGEKAFMTIKAKPTEAPALGLPDVTQDFNLFAHENNGDGVALGVLTQELGSWQRPVAYLSKQIDLVASGWPHASGPLQPRPY